MVSYCVAPRPVAAVPVLDTDESFPIARIFCVGQNYAAHTREMGGDPTRDPPFFFAKDPDAYVPDGATIAYPPETADYHHEIELVVAIGAAGFRVAAGDAASLVFGYAVGLDMTRRDLQAAAKKLGRPWSTAKNFPQSAPIGPISPIARTGDLSHGRIALSVNGVVRQQSDLDQMIWPVRDIIAYLSRYYALRPGDLIFTGTPAGVGPVAPGDVLAGSIAGLSPLTVTIGAPLAA